MNTNLDSNFNVITDSTHIIWMFCLQFITRKWRVFSINVGCSIEHPNPHLIAFFQLYNSQFATLQICLRCTIITMIPWLKFTINDECGGSIFSILGESGPVKNKHSRSRCCENSSGRIIPIAFVQIFYSKDNPPVCGKVINMVLQSYVKSNNIFF